MGEVGAGVSGGWRPAGPPSVVIVAAFDPADFDTGPLAGPHGRKGPRLKVGVLDDGLSDATRRRRRLLQYNL